MNKFTLLRTIAMGVGGKDYETEDQEIFNVPDKMFLKGFT